MSAPDLDADLMDKSARWLKQMERAAADPDTEAAHFAADRVLLAIVKRHGYREIAAAYEKVTKWYA